MVGVAGATGAVGMSATGPVGAWSVGSLLLLLTRAGKLFVTAPAVAASGAATSACVAAAVAGAATGSITVGCSVVVLVTIRSGMRGAAMAVVVATCVSLMGTGGTVMAAVPEAAASVLTGRGTTCLFPALPTTTVAGGDTAATDAWTKDATAVEGAVIEVGPLTWIAGDGANAAVPTARGLCMSPCTLVFSTRVRGEGDMGEGGT